MQIQSSRNKAQRSQEANTLPGPDAENHCRVSTNKIEGVRLIQDWSVRDGTSGDRRKLMRSKAIPGLMALIGRHHLEL